MARVFLCLLVHGAAPAGLAKRVIVWDPKTLKKNAAVAKKKAQRDRPAPIAATAEAGAAVTAEVTAPARGADSREVAAVAAAPVRARAAPVRRVVALAAPVAVAHMPRAGAHEAPARAAARKAHAQVAAAHDTDVRGAVTHKARGTAAHKASVPGAAEPATMQQQSRDARDGQLPSAESPRVTTQASLLGRAMADSHCQHC